MGNCKSKDKSDNLVEISSNNTCNLIKEEMNKIFLTDGPIFHDSEDEEDEFDGIPFEELGRAERIGLMINKIRKLHNARICILILDYMGETEGWVESIIQSGINKYRS